ncbi:MAG: hypothetical protein JWN15_1355 [Firmicutes bacterium]|nr:hypothetical protein [Bacillota bacterium]
MKFPQRIVWPYLLLSVALFGALGFGWSQTLQKNHLALDNENRYMSAFHKLKWTSENIEERMSRLVATTDPRLQESLLSDLRVYSGQAVEHMSILPLLTMNTPRLGHYLNTLQESTTNLHDKLNDGSRLSTADWQQVDMLRKQSVAFESELSNMLGLLGNHLVHWDDTVRATSPAQTGEFATPITRSVALLEQALPVPPGSANALAPDAGGVQTRPLTDPGPRVNEAQARDAVRRFSDTPLQGEPQLTQTTDPQDQTHQFSLYYFNATKASGTPATFGVSVHGGHVIFMMDGRAVNGRNLTEPQLTEKARALLSRWGYPAAERVSAVENEGTLIMDFAPRENGAAVQTELIKVTLAEDNGELVGFDARNYWINHRPRTLPPATLSAAQARAHISPRLTVESEPSLSVVADRRGNERLTWEVRSRLDDQHYQVFVDATTGEEVNILRVGGDPAPPLNTPRR